MVATAIVSLIPSLTSDVNQVVGNDTIAMRDTQPRYAIHKRGTQTVLEVSNYDPRSASDCTPSES